MDSIDEKFQLVTELSSVSAPTASTEPAVKSSSSKRHSMRRMRDSFDKSILSIGINGVDRLNSINAYKLEENLRNLFSQLDPDKDGRVRLDELLVGIRELSTYGKCVSSFSSSYGDTDGIHLTEAQFMNVIGAISELFNKDSLGSSITPSPSPPTTSIIEEDKVVKDEKVTLNDNYTIEMTSTKQIELTEKPNIDRFKSISSPIEIKNDVYHPGGNFCLIWNIAMFCLIVYNTIVIPFRMSFGYLDTSVGFWAVFDWVTDSYFIIDVFIRFRMGYYEDGELVMDKERIKSRYFKTWFIFDVLAAMPLDFICIGYGVLLPITRINKLIRVAHVIEKLSSLEGIPGISLMIVRLTKLIFLAYLMIHIIACLYFWFSVEISSGLSTTTFTQPLEEQYDRGPVNAYIFCLYWATGLMAFFSLNSDGNPELIQEVFFVIAVMFTGLFAFAYILTQIDTLWETTDRYSVRFQNQCEQVTKLMSEKRIPNSLRWRVLDYFDHIWASKKGGDPERLLDIMPGVLRADVNMSIQSQEIMDIPLFNRFGSDVIYAILSELRPRIFVPGEAFYIKGTSCDFLTFVHLGFVKLSDSPLHITPCPKFDEPKFEGEMLETPANRNDMRSVSVANMEEVLGGKLVGQGTCIGQDCIGETVNCTAIAETFVHVVTLKHSRLLHILNQHEIEKKLYDDNFQSCKRMDPDELYPPAKIEEEYNKSPTKIGCINAILNYLRDPFTTINPKGRFRGYWLTVIILVTIYNAWFIPYRIGFWEKASERYQNILIIDIFCDIILLIDIFMNFRVACRSEKGLLEKNYSKISDSYIKSSLFFDILAILPLDLFAWSLHPAWRINRLIKTSQFDKMLHARIATYMRVRLNRWQSFLRLIFGFIFLTHWFAIGYGIYSREFGYGSDNWVIPAEFSTSPPKAYFFSVYFVYDCMLRLGSNVSPNDETSEIAYTIIMILTGHFFAAFIIGRVGQTLATFDNFRAAFAEELWDIGEYLKRYQLKPSLKSRVVQFFQFRWAYQEKINRYQALKSLPTFLSQEILVCICKPLLENNSILPKDNEAFLREFVDCVNIMSMPAHEFVYRAGDYGTEIYFVESGLIQILDANELETDQFEKGALFGEDCIFKTGVRRNESAKTCTPCDLMTISRVDLLNLIRKYPELRTLVRSNPNF